MTCYEYLLEKLLIIGIILWLKSLLVLLFFVDAGKGCWHPLHHQAYNVRKETSGSDKIMNNAVDFIPR